MTCDETAALLGARTDGELDRLRAHALDRHLAGCANCASRNAVLLDLKGRLRGELPRHPAPEALRSRIRARLANVDSTPVPTRAAQVGRWRWFGAGTLAGGLFTGLLWVMLASGSWPSPGGGLSERLVGLHTRATLGNHLIEIASSDRHVVKPWLSARLDYAIPVTDWATSGFPLAGARIDSLEGSPTATLVYRRGNHVVDVFVRPVSGPPRPVSMHTVRGFNVATAQGAQMNWWAVSDLNATELETFVRGLAEGQVAPASR